MGSSAPAELMPGVLGADDHWIRNRGELVNHHVWMSALDEWQQWLSAAGKPSTTLYLRSYQMRRFANEIHSGPWVVTLALITAWLAGHDWSTETRRSYRAALRSFYGWAHLTGQMDHNPAGLLPSIRRAEGRPRPTPLYVIRSALENAPPRTRLMVLLAARQGLRRGEICKVHSDDLTPDLTGWTLRVHGKGNRARDVPLDDDVARLLRERPPGYAFPGQVDGHLSPARVGELVSEVLGPGWATHSLRHRFATSAYAGQRDLFAVQTLLGHQSPETTRRYVQLPDDALRAAVRGARFDLYTPPTEDTG